MSVYDEIRRLARERQDELDGQGDAIEEARTAAEASAREAYDQAVREAEDAYEAAFEPIDAEVKQLAEVLATLPDDGAESPVDPTQPAETPPTEASSSPSQDGTSESEPTDTSPATTSESEPSDSTTSGEPSAPQSDEADTEPTDDVTVVLAGAATAVTASLAAVVEPETPVQVNLLATGEIKVVTAADVVAADDLSIPQEELSADARVLRNSDFL